jgi:hypothetical protein
MKSTTLRLTKARLYFIDHFEGEERRHLIAMLEKYQADGIFPEIEENAMHMAFGAVAKSIDSAKKRATTKAAKAAAAMGSDASVESVGSERADSDRAENDHVVSDKVDSDRVDCNAASAATAPSVTKAAQTAKDTQSKPGESKPAAAVGADRKFLDFQRFYKAFPFTKKNKIGLKRAYEMWQDFAMDAEPIDVVLKALNRDKGRGKFNKHAPSLHQWLCWETWAA